MASIRMFLNGQAGKYEEIDGLTLEMAKSMASELMAKEVPPFVTPTGIESTFPYERVQIFNDDGTYRTTAWGE